MTYSKRIVKNILGDRYSKNKETQTTLTEKRKCDFCDKEAKFDAKTQIGPWAYMCDHHFQMYGVGLGVGRGQRLK